MSARQWGSRVAGQWAVSDSYRGRIVAQLLLEGRRRPPSWLAQRGVRRRRADKKTDLARTDVWVWVCPGHVAPFEAPRSSRAETTTTGSRLARRVGGYGGVAVVDRREDLLAVREDVTDQVEVEPHALALPEAWSVVRRMVFLKDRVCSSRWSGGADC